MFDFAGTLAQRLAELVKARKLQPASILWVYAVDNLLIKAVDSQTQVHEEVLRLLLAAAPFLAPAQLGVYLKLTLDNSKRSRRRVKKHLSGPLGSSFGGDGFSVMLNDAEVGGGSDIGSDGWAGIMALKNRSSDAVRSVYSKFKTVRLHGGGLLTCETAPALFNYLDEPQDEDGGGGRQPGEGGVAVQQQAQRGGGEGVAASEPQDGPSA